jgi:hypothetical protein
MMEAIMIDIKKYPVVDVPLSELKKAQGFQCRAKQDKKEVEDMAQSLKEIGQQTPCIGIDYGDRKALIDGNTRLAGADLAGLPALKVIWIPIADLPNPKQDIVDLSYFYNSGVGQLKPVDNMVYCWMYWESGLRKISEIARKIKNISRRMVRLNLLVYLTGPEIHDAVRNGILPLIKTAEYVAKDDEDTVTDGGGGTQYHPPSEGSDNLQIDVEKTNKLIEALKNPDPKEAGKAVLASGGQAPSQAGSGQGSEAAGRQASMPEFEGLKNKLIKLIAKKPDDEFKKAVSAEIDRLKEAVFNEFKEQKKKVQEKALEDKQASKPVEKQPSPAELEKAVNKKQEQADTNDKQIAGLEYVLEDMTAKGEDTTALKKRLDELQVKQKELKAELTKLKRQLKSANVAAELALPDSKGVKSKTAKQASQLQDKADPNHSIPQSEIPIPQSKMEALARRDWKEFFNGMPPAMQIPQVEGLMSATNIILSRPGLPEEKRQAEAQKLATLQAYLDELQKAPPPVQSYDLAEVEAQKKRALELVNRMSKKDMESVKAQYEADVVTNQRELAKPDTNEAKAAWLKAWIQMEQEVIEAINKKLSGQ